MPTIPQRADIEVIMWLASRWYLARVKRAMSSEVEHFDRQLAMM